MRRLCLLAVVLAACHKPESLAVDARASDAPTDAEPGWTTLISRSWMLDPDTEGYKCTRIVVPSDLWVTGFRAISPPGTHHSVLTISTTNTPLGDYDCSPNNLDQEMVYASGVDTDDLLLPAGVAIHLTAGMYLNLNLHLFNAMDTPTTQTSGVEIKTLDPADVIDVADMSFAGTFNIDIPNDGVQHTAVGGCQVSQDWHVFALWPHMHQTGVHQSLVVTHGATSTTLLDTAFAFGEQRNYPITDTLIHQGDQVQVTCTYINTTAINPLVFGDSTNEEMCFTGVYKYPANPAGTSIYDCASS